MADNYLEYRMGEYEKKKAEYLKRKKNHLPKNNKRRSSDK